MSTIPLAITETPLPSVRPTRQPSRQTLWRRSKLKDCQKHTLQLAQELMTIADDENNVAFREELTELVDRIRKHGKRSYTENLKLVLRAIQYQECDSIEDICEETSMFETVVKDIVIELIYNGAAEVQMRPGVGPGSGIGGRPALDLSTRNLRKPWPRQWKIVLTGKPAGPDGDIVVGSPAVTPSQN